MLEANWEMFIEEVSFEMDPKDSAGSLQMVTASPLPGWIKE